MAANINRRGIIRLHEHQIVQALMLPNGTHVISLYTNYERNTVDIVVVNDDLEYVAPGEQAPILQGRFRPMSWTPEKDPDGKG